MRCATDDREVAVQAQNAADQAGLQLAAEHLALDLDGDRVDGDDRELALGQQGRSDLDALDRPAELQPRHALDPGHGRRQREDEVLRVVLDVGPLDAERVDADREERRPLERVARRRPDGEEHSETLQRFEGPVAADREVASFAADDERTDGDFRADEFIDEGRLAGVRSEVPAAPVARRKSRAVSVTKVPRRTSRVSMLIWKAWTLPAAKVTAIRNASVSAVPSGRRSSAVSRSEIVAPNAPLGKSLAPPEAM